MRDINKTFNSQRPAAYYHHSANLSEDIELLNIEIFVIYILSSVWVRLSIFSQLSIIQYMGLCVFSLPISLVMIERIYTLSYWHHQIGNMNYYPLFRVRSWNNGMRCVSLYILTAKLSWCNSTELYKLFPCGVCLYDLWFMSTGCSIDAPLCHRKLPRPHI